MKSDFLVFLVPLALILALVFSPRLRRARVRDRLRAAWGKGAPGRTLEKELVEEAGRLDVPCRPITYRTTTNFLRCFGITSLAELPPLPGNSSAEAPEEPLE